MQDERGRVADRVHAADAAAAAVQLGPVREAGRGGRDSGEDAGGDETVGRLLSPLAADQVEKEGARQRPDHRVRERWVQRDGRARSR
jgi:hypothetical protein